MKNTITTHKPPMTQVLAIAAGLAVGLAEAADPVLPTFRLDELAAHATEDSCWMAIEGQVYDVTDHIPTHPAPPEIVVPWCGRDATMGMRTKGYGEEHSPAAWEMLADYLIGTLAEGPPQE